VAQVHGRLTSRKREFYSIYYSIGVDVFVHCCFGFVTSFTTCHGGDILYIQKKKDKATPAEKKTMIL